ncbi:MAG: NAD-dependent epimerase/dehydratase family protein [Candidatus Firestonebacteria bacterium]
MKVLVTGGAGFIGSHIVDECIKKGHEVIILDDLSTGKKENINHLAKFYKYDITTSEATRILKKDIPDYIIHHAAQISVSKSVRSPFEDARVNIMGTLRLLEFARLNGVKKIIFASSGGTIYGEPNKFPITEKFKFDASSPYGMAKMIIEYYLRFYYKEYKLPYISLRYSNVYGPRQDSHGEAGVVAIFVKSMLGGITPIINGDGKYIRDYVYCGDVVNANMAALKSDVVGGFNIGTNTGTDVNELYKKLAKIIGFKEKPKCGPARAGDLRKNILSFDKAKRVLKWKPVVLLDEGLKKTVKYF